MGTRCLTVVMDGNKEILCMYRQYDGYISGHGAELKKFAHGFKIVNGFGSDTPKKSANGMGCFAAQLVAHFKGKKENQIGGFYIEAPETREVGEEFIYRLSEKSGKLWLDISEGEVAWFGLPGTKPELMDWIYSGFMDDFDPDADHGEQYHARQGCGNDARPAA